MEFPSRARCSPSTLISQEAFFPSVVPRLRKLSNNSHWQSPPLLPAELKLDRFARNEQSHFNSRIQMITRGARLYFGFSQLPERNRERYFRACFHEHVKTYFFLLSISRVYSARIIYTR